MAERRTGVLVWLVGILLLAALPGEAQTKPDAAARDQFVGAWRLVSIETVRPNGEVIYPFYGKHPQGLIMYDRSAWMSVQILADPAPTAPALQSREAVLAAPAGEKVQAFDGYYAYCGTWTVDPAKTTVTHRIRQSLTPGEKDEDAVRHFCSRRRSSDPNGENA